MKTIKIVIQRSKTSTGKFGYRFRARSTGGYDYSFKGLKELASEGNNFEFRFDGNVPTEQREYVFDKYKKLGLDIINFPNMIDNGGYGIGDGIEINRFDTTDIESSRG